MLCFEAAARSQSFSRAAEDMHISQSAVSRQIQILEAFVGQSLFVRNKQRVRLTSAGASLLAELSPTLENLELVILKNKSRDDMHGALSIGVYPTLGSRWLIPQISDIHTALPRHNLNMVTYLDNSQIDPSQVDLAIVQGDPPWKGYQVDLLMPETLVLISSPELLAAPLEDPFKALEYRILQHSTRPQSWDIWFKHQNLKLDRRIIGPTFSQFQMLIDAVKAAHGIAIVPKILVEVELRGGSLIKAHDFEARPSSAYYLLTPDAKIGVARIDKLRRWLLQNAKNDA